MATGPIDTGTPTGTGTCACCGGVQVVCDSCLSGPVTVPSTLLGTFNTPGSGTVACACPYAFPLDFYNAFIPAGGDGTSLVITYDSGIGKWANTFLACDGTTATLYGYFTTTGTNCIFEGQVINPTQPSVTNISWAQDVVLNSPGFCTGSPLFLTGLVISFAALQPCDLQLTIQA